MRIDYTRNFTKFCSSKEEALRIASKVANWIESKVTKTKVPWEW